MKVLSVFGGTIRTGGDTKSALAHIKYLKRLGHDITIMAPLEGSIRNMIDCFSSLGVDVCDGRAGAKRRRFPDSVGADDILQVCHRKAIDLIHAQDFNSLSASLLVAARLKRPLVFTKAGGPVNNAFPPKRINSVFYSKELYDGMVDRFGLTEDRIFVIPERIDTEVYKPQQPSGEFISKYALPSSGQKIVMAIRLVKGKKPWLDNILKFAEQAVSMPAPPHVVIAGEGPLLDYLKSEAEKINVNIGKKIVHFIGPVFAIEEIVQLYNYADIVAGNGRGIMEAMACSKPVVNLGENGEAVLLGPENIQSIAEYNFSGRHFRFTKEHNMKLPILLDQLIKNPDRYRSAGLFSSDYVMKKLDAKIGARKIAEVYSKAMLSRYNLYDYYRWHLRIRTVKIISSIRRRLGVNSANF